MPFPMYLVNFHSQNSTFPQTGHIAQSAVKDSQFQFYPEILSLPLHLYLTLTKRHSAGLQRRCAKSVHTLTAPGKKHKYISAVATGRWRRLSQLCNSLTLEKTLRFWQTALRPSPPACGADAAAPDDPFRAAGRASAPRMRAGGRGAERNPQLPFSHQSQSRPGQPPSLPPPLPRRCLVPVTHRRRDGVPPTGAGAGLQGRLGSSSSLRGRRHAEA